MAISTVEMGRVPGSTDDNCDAYLALTAPSLR